MKDMQQQQQQSEEDSEDELDHDLSEKKVSLHLLALFKHPVSEILPFPTKTNPARGKY